MSRLTAALLIYKFAETIVTHAVAMRQETRERLFNFEAGAADSSDHSHTRASLSRMKNYNLKRRVYRECARAR